MINYRAKGHDYAYHVQTMVQLFYANEHYVLVDEIQEQGITIESILYPDRGEAVFYKEGLETDRKSFPYDMGKEREKEEKRVLKGSMFLLLQEETGITPQWGFLTGVRPAKTVTRLLEEGKTEEECLSYLEKGYFVTTEKAKLALAVSNAERNILKVNHPKDCSVYIGIPFCPTRCLYCSFTAYPLAQYKNQVDGYLDALEKELRFLGEYVKERHVSNVYIGGGTPTSLTERQLERLLSLVQALFMVGDTIEFTVEAGRPDTITREKLQMMKAYGVNRISINPQTMNQVTLDSIGRKHTVADIQRVFWDARELGHENINMDLILGLTNENAFHVEHTMKEIQKLAPDNVTVHTLAVKRASRLKEEFSKHTLTAVSEMEKMIAIASDYAEKMGMKPYYMYRQKNMVGNLENVGYGLPGKEGIYNIQIMEEKQTILAAGCGGSTKVVDPVSGDIRRIFNIKGVEEYILRIDEMIQRKKDGLPR